MKNDATKQMAAEINRDTDLDRLMNEPRQGRENAALELSVATAGQVEIAGRLFPAPAAAVYCLLEAIDSPFMPSDAESIERDPADIDIFHALYLLAEREKAVAPILRLKRRAEQLEYLENSLKDKLSPETLIVIAEHRRTLADAWAEFDTAAISFGLSLGVFHPAAAAADIQMYLSLASGFDWLPHNDKDVKKNVGATPNI